MTLNEISAATQAGFPLLSVLVWLPLLAAVAIAAVRDERSARLIGLIATGGVLALSLWLLASFKPGTADLQFVERVAWLPGLGIHYLLGVDGLSVLFLPLTALVFLGILACAGHTKTYPRLFLVNLLVLESATLGIYAALDLILFFCFFEIALVPSFWLIRLWGMGAQRQQAASKYLLYMLVGSLPILLGFLLLGLNHADAVPGAGVSFAWPALLQMTPELKTQFAVFGLLAAGFAVKGPALPFHTWMPTAVMEGPIGIGAYLLGLKVGTYGFLRFVLPLTPDASRELAWLIIATELVAIVYAGLLALVQLNFRRLLVFASVSHVALIMVAAFSMTAPAWQGALLLMVNAGIATAGLVLCAGFLYRRLGSTDLQAMGGLARPLPKLATFCFVAGLALIGVPGTSGFGGELLAMSGVYRADWRWAVLCALGVILSAGYFMWFYQRAFFGPLRNPVALRVADLDRGELSVAVGLMAVIFAVGLYPRALTSRTEASVVAMTQRLRPAPPAAAPVASAHPGGPRESQRWQSSP